MNGARDHVIQVPRQQQHQHQQHQNNQRHNEAVMPMDVYGHQQANTSMVPYTTNNNNQQQQLMRQARPTYNQGFETQPQFPTGYGAQYASNPYEMQHGGYPSSFPSTHPSNAMAPVILYSQERAYENRHAVDARLSTTTYTAGYRDGFSDCTDRSAESDYFDLLRMERERERARRWRRRQGGGNGYGNGYGYGNYNDRWRGGDEEWFDERGRVRKRAPDVMCTVM
ncbi:MAG: hypothetical protein M1833_002321 [Piccolia ochrophora]|nr:MAG: hypothetical protein M1833_002321 [Piccolia ochrophora]